MARPVVDGGGHASRPTLQRLTSSHRDLVLAALQPGSSMVRGDGIRRSLDELGPWRAKSIDGHREALIHEIQRQDTVAGIALQYGLTAQALRQANRLWSNDSIHLRKTLYIPLDACTIPPARELIERIEVEGDQVTIYSRPLPKRPFPPMAPPPKPFNGSAATRRSTSLDLERLPTSSRTSMESSSSLYLPETNPTYGEESEVTSPNGTECLVDVEVAAAPLIERRLKLGLVPQPPSSNQPFFRLSPSSSAMDLTASSATYKPPPIRAKAEAFPMKMPGGSDGWGAADEIAMAQEFIQRIKGKRH